MKVTAYFSAENLPSILKKLRFYFLQKINKIKKIVYFSNKKKSMRTKCVFHVLHTCTKFQQSRGNNIKILLKTGRFP